jgi:uncharacterized tellurite resistance protein B-like protein
MTNFLDTKTNTDLPKGVIGCVQCAMYADGDANDIEISKMATLLAGRSLFSNISFIDVYKQNMNLYVGLGADYLLKESAKLVTEDWKATTYAMCCEVLFSDTQVGTVEKEFLKKLQQQLELHDTIVNKIIEVMLILHKGRLAA